MTLQLPTLGASQAVYKTDTQTSWMFNSSAAAGQWQIAFLQQYTAIGQQVVVFTPPPGWVAIRVPLLINTLTVAVYAHKCLPSDPATWTFTSNQTTAGLLLALSGSDPGASDPATWIISGATRASSGTATTNVAPTVTTTVPSLLLSLSAERTNAVETTGQVTVDAAWTKYLFVPQQGLASNQSAGIETMAVATLAQSAAGPSPASTWTYPNSQATNGWAGQVAIPGYTAPAAPNPTIVGSGAQSTVNGAVTPPSSGLGGSNATKTIILAAPAGVQDGDLLLAVIGEQNTAEAGKGYVSPGWSFLTPASYATGCRSLDISTLPVTSAAALPASWTFTSGIATTNRRTGRIFIVRGVNPVAAIGAVSGTLDTLVATAPIPPLTTTGASSLLFLAETENIPSPNTGIPVTDPAGTTLLLSDTAPTNAADTSVTRTRLICWTLPAAGSGTVFSGLSFTRPQGAGGAVRVVELLAGSPTPTSLRPTVGVTTWTGTTEAPAGVSVMVGAVEMPTAGPLEFAKGGPHTINSVIKSGRPFYFAHRGGSVNWPEMTAYAYKASALAYEMPGLEISVFRSSDGVFICSHDQTTTRCTGQTFDIPTTPAATLLALDVTIGGTDPPPVKPKLVRLTDILDLYAVTHLIIVEDKSYQNGAALRTLIQTYPNYQQHFLWKSYGNGGTNDVVAAHALGLSSWGYFFDGDMPNFAAKQALFTYVGCDFSSSDATLTNAIALATPARSIGHIIASATQRDRMLRLGNIGLMVSNVRQVTRTAIIP